MVSELFPCVLRNVLEIQVSVLLSSLLSLHTVAQVPDLLFRLQHLMTSQYLKLWKIAGNVHLI